MNYKMPRKSKNQPKNVLSIDYESPNWTVIEAYFKGQAFEKSVCGIN